MRHRPDPVALLGQAYEQAQRGLAEGGVPIGAVLVAADGTVLGAGRNGNVQDDDQLLHAETAAVRDAGRRSDYRDTTLVTTMATCWYCAGLVRFLGIGAVVAGDCETWSDDALDWLSSAGVRVTKLNDRRCVVMFADWLAAEPPIWALMPASTVGSQLVVGAPPASKPHKPPR